MVRLFKHYVPHAVLLLGLIDCALLFLVGDLAWSFRAAQIGMDSGALADRLTFLLGFVAVVLGAMTAVGFYGSEALRSLRFATARLLVAVSLAVIALALLDFVLPGRTFWRSTLLYAMGLSIALLMANRIIVVGGILCASHNDPRVTRICRLICKVRIDELPQVWTVLRGRMSFVGPHPEVPAFVEDLEDRLPYFAEPHMVKPGITGWAQINYPYGASIEGAR